MTAATLVLNAGSSSIKVALFPFAPAGEKEAPLYHGEIEDIGDAEHAARLAIKDAGGKPLTSDTLGANVTHEQALAALLNWIAKAADIDLTAAGHRVVHGGVEFAAPVKITPAVVAKLAALAPLAPLHQPHNLAAIAALSKLHPTLPQVACFDTAFHVSEPHVATAFALPRALSQKGVRRYGFHGLSYEYIASVLPEHLGSAADGKVVVAHLGHGASMCAMNARRSIATTMGFSALDGLVMGRRCGNLDPGVILYLLDSEHLNSAGVSDLLYKQSGLFGVSGISDDMRDLLANPRPEAAEAVDLFVYRIVRELGSLAAALAGLDALVFTGGIGEHAAPIRARVGAASAWLGVKIDDKANAAGGPRISTKDSAVAVLALPTNEELTIARHVRTVLRAPAAANMSMT